MPLRKFPEIPFPNAGIRKTDSRKMKVKRKVEKWPPQKQLQKVLNADKVQIAHKNIKTRPKEREQEQDQKEQMQRTRRKKVQFTTFHFSIHSTSPEGNTHTYRNWKDTLVSDGQLVWLGNWRSHRLSLSIPHTHTHGQRDPPSPAILATLSLLRHSPKNFAFLR